jgi:hypothetical protein
MTVRRTFAGVGVVFALAVWAWCRPGADQAHARTADPIYTAETADECGGGNHDEAAARYRAGQSRHWRQVMFGQR